MYCTVLCGDCPCIVQYYVEFNMYHTFVLLLTKNKTFRIDCSYILCFLL